MTNQMPETSLTVRPEATHDQQSVWNVNRSAFKSDDEAILVNALRDGGFFEVSLVAEQNAEIIGHILFSRLSIITGEGSVEAVSLAPMAVLPSHQRLGIGSKLVMAGLEACRELGHKIVVVLGHPTFYPRFGFSAERAQPLKNPFGGGEAWMGLELIPGSLSGIAGRVEYPPPFGG